MKVLKDFRISQIDGHDIVAFAKEDTDYSCRRMIVLESGYDFIVVDYGVTLGWEDWEYDIFAIQYTADEYAIEVEKWKDDSRWSSNMERKIAKTIA